MVSDGKAVTKDFSQLNKYEVTKKGSKIAVIGAGTFYQLGTDAAALIEEQTGVAPTIINPLYVSGMDEELLNGLKKDHDIVITLEDGYLEGGYDVNEVLKENHLTAEQIAEDVKKG